MASWVESNHSKKTGIRGWGITRRALAFRNYFHQLFKINMPGLGQLGGGFRNHRQFRKDLRAYLRLQAASTDARIQKFPVLREEISPYLRDMEMGAGAVGGDYFYQDIWAARKIHERMPDGHVDIGSRIDGFIAHLLVFMENVTVMDVRPIKESVRGLRFVEADCREEQLKTNRESVLDRFWSVFPDPRSPELLLSDLHRWENNEPSTRGWTFMA